MTNDMEEIRQKLSNAATSPFWIKIQPLTKSIPHYDIASFFLDILLQIGFDYSFLWRIKESIQ